MKKDWSKTVSKIIGETWEGYSVVKINPTSDSNHFRAMVKKPSGSTEADIRIKLWEGEIGDIIAYITNYSEGEEEVAVNLTDGKVVDIKDQRFRDVKPQIELQEDDVERFAEKIPTATEDRENPLLTAKKIKMYGRAFNVDSKTWGEILNPICVPFYSSLKHEEDNKPCAAQIIGFDKNQKSRKMSIAGSKPSNAFHVLQYGEVDTVFKNRDGFISESYTTACEIAEAMPDNFVACSAGLSNQLGAGKVLSLSGINIIYVLDKVKAGKTPHNKEVEIKQAMLPYIQLDVMDVALTDITDFNDFALLWDKRTVKKEIALQSHRYLTTLPEVLSYDSETGFTILNPITQTVDRLKMKYINKYLGEMCSITTRKAFMKQNAINKNDLQERLKPILLNAVARSLETVPRGVGIFKDRGGFVLNLTRNDRYMLDNTGVSSTTKLKPFNNERYFNSPLRMQFKNGGNPEILKNEFTEETLRSLVTLWNRSFDMDESEFLLLLGFLAQACYASFTTCSPHVWLRGTTGTGKSYVLKNIVNNLLNGINFTLQDSTKAGVEQELARDDALNCPLIWLDEAGMDTASKKHKVTDLLMTTREMFLGGLVPSCRGTKDLVPKMYFKAFSMIFSSVTDGLKDNQDIGRFIMMDMKGFKLKGLDYETVGKQFLGLNPAFMRGVFEGSKHYARMFSLISQQIADHYKIDREHIGHKVITLTACIAGLAALIKVATKWDDMRCVDIALKKCRRAVHIQDFLHKEKIGMEDNFVDFLKRTYFQVGEMRGRLCDLCEPSQESEMFESFGVFLRPGKKDCYGHYNLLIDKTKFRLDALLSNPKQIIGEPIHDGLSRLWELKKSHDDVTITKIGPKEFFVIKRFCLIKDN